MVVYATKAMSSPATKYLLPTTKNFVIYKYKCHCDSCYKERHLNIYKITSSSTQMANSIPVLNNYNLIACVRKNKPLKNVTQPLVNTFCKVVNALPTTRNINSPSSIKHAVNFISVCQKQPTSRYSTQPLQTKRIY